MNHLERFNPFLLTVVILMFVSSVSPWIGSKLTSGDWSVVPLTSGAMKPSAVLLLIMAVSGLLSSTRWIYGKHLVSLASTIWGACCVWVWLIGGRLRFWLPDGIVPQGLIPNVRMGVYIGVLAAMVVLIETFAPSWFILQRNLNWIIQQTAVIGLIALIISTRELPWATFYVQGVPLEVGTYSLPIFSDIYGICCLTLVASLLFASLGSRLIAKILSLMFSLFILVAGIMAFLLRDGVNWIARQTLGLAGFKSQNLDTVEINFGPQVMMTTGVLGVLLSIYMLWSHRQTRRFSVMPVVKTPKIDVFDGAKYL